MLKGPQALVITGDGTNCEMETAYACRLGGFPRADIVHISELIYGEKKLVDYQFLCLAGGFLDGDDLGSAKAGANRFRHARVKPGGEPFFEDVLQFVKAGKPVIGICNGFQLLVKLGLLPALKQDYSVQLCTLTFNDSGRFEDRWVYLQVEDSPCIFTHGLKRLYFPVRHGEGKFVCRDEKVLAELKKSRLVTLIYTDPDYSGPTMEYPWNPNGSETAIAGICNPEGNIFGLMPHPEAYLHFSNHPRWLREKLISGEGMGVSLFRNAYQYCREQSF